jgi:hypothetical protein
MGTWNCEPLQLLVVVKRIGDLLGQGGGDVPAFSARMVVPALSIGCQRARIRALVGRWTTRLVEWRPHARDDIA